MCTAGLLPSRGRPCYRYFADSAVSAPAAVAERGGIAKKKKEEKNHAHPHHTKRLSRAISSARFIIIFLFTPHIINFLSQKRLSKPRRDGRSHKTLVQKPKCSTGSLLRASRGHANPTRDTRTKGTRHQRTQEERDECSPPSRAPESKLRCGGSAARGAVVAAPAARAGVPLSPRTPTLPQGDAGARSARPLARSRPPARPPALPLAAASADRQYTCLPRA